MGTEMNAKRKWGDGKLREKREGKKDTHYNKSNIITMRSGPKSDFSVFLGALLDIHYC